MVAKKVVLTFPTMTDDKTRRKAIKVAASIHGVESVAVDTIEKKLTVIGEMDAVIVLKELRKKLGNGNGNVSIVSVGPAKEKEKEDEKKEEKPAKDLGPAKEDKKKEKPAEDLKILAKEEEKKEKPAEVVGSSSGSGTKTLGQVQAMLGNLSATSLENVVIVDNVSRAHLKDERPITDLSLEWEEGHTNDSQNAVDLLNRLQTLTDLEQLSIINYRGENFSDWISDHSFSRIVYMWLSRCKTCRHLPPLGKLPCLKSLSIDEFDMVKRIGDEFYISGSSTATKPFMSLEKLSFKCMPRWMEWSLVEGGVFPQLKELHLMDCPSLTLNKACFPDCLPSLTCLYISKCQHQVVASLLSGQLPLLGSLYIGYCPELESFPERRLPTNIHKIEIFGCQNLELFLEDGWPSNLKSLSVGGCRKLFVPHMQWNLRTLTSLTSLHFSCMDELVDSFPEEGQLPTTLTSLTLCHLHNLKSLNGKAFQQLISLEELSISYCKQLKCMPKEGLPRTLTSLHLSCLDSLKSLNGKALVQLSSLEKLSISYCPQLPCMPEQRLPASLSQLTIEWCRFLNPRCQREIGEDWPMIAHIPCIRINPKLI